MVIEAGEVEANGGGVEAGPVIGEIEKIGSGAALTKSVSVEDFLELILTAKAEQSLLALQMERACWNAMRFRLLKFVSPEFREDCLYWM